MEVTLKDIAARIGVSNQVVSAVLNGKTNCRVSKEKRERILALARELKYQPNRLASGLRTGKSRIIGVLTDTHAGYNRSYLLQEIERAARKRNYRILTSNTHDDLAGLAENSRQLFNYGAAGMICLAHDYPEFREEFAEVFTNDRRLVFLEKPAFPGCRSVSASRREGLIRLAADCKRQGITRIALIHSDPVSITERNLVSEYREAMELNGLSPDPHLQVQFSFRHSTIRETCERILEEMILPYRPELVYSEDAEHAIYLQSRLTAMGWKVPEDILFYGGNNDPFFQYAAPPICSLKPRYGVIAEHLVSAALDHTLYEEGVTVEAEYVPFEKPRMKKNNIKNNERKGKRK